jgi:hypothetical protein
MAANLDSRSAQLLEAKNFCTVATFSADGTIHAAPVWVDIQDGLPTLNTAEGGDEHIDALAKKYLGQDTYPDRRPGEQRVIIRVEPERVYNNTR